MYILLKRFLPLFAMGMFIGSLATLGKVFFLGGYPDFTSYYYGSQTLSTMQNPYLGNEQSFTPFVYPPPVLLFFFPLSLLPYRIAEVTWTIVSFILLLLSLFLLFQHYNIRFFSVRGLLMSSMVFASFPLKFSLGMGQINTAILLLMTLFYTQFLAKKWYVSGVMLAVSLSLKLFPLLLILYLLLTKSWKTLKAVLITLILIAIVSSIFVSGDAVSFFFTKTLPTHATSWKAYYYNQSVSGVISRHIPDMPTKTVMRIASLLVILLTYITIVATSKKTSETIPLMLSLTITSTLLLNTFSWQHHFIWLLLPFLIVFFSLQNRKEKHVLYGVLGISYILVSINLKTPESVPLLLQSHVFLGTVLLWTLTMFLLLPRKK